jgi:formylglycine-generating enzyme required for sulfatase activity
MRCRLGLPAACSFRSIHRRIAVRELDVAATVQATLDRGGMFTPRYGLRKASPEYLLLIDRASFGDQQARFGGELARSLEANGVFVDVYYFQTDPRTCRNREPESPTIPLLDLAARHADHQLLIFGDGAGLFSPATGEPESWLTMFSHWPHPVLLTPEFAGPPEHRRRALAEHQFLVLPANADGLAALTDAINAGTPDALRPKPKWNGARHSPPFPKLILERPKRWLDRNEPRSAVARELCGQLKPWLGDETWFWLAACAVYPALSWDITLYLGYKLFGKTEASESRLLRLVRLPWFRHGTMPDWMRWLLISSFTAEQETAVRHALEELLLSALENPHRGVELEIAEPEPDDAPGRWLRRLQTLRETTAAWRRKLRIEDAINAQPEDSPLRDYVFRSFLAGSHKRRAKRLAVRWPDKFVVPPSGDQVNPVNEPLPPEGVTSNVATHGFTEDLNGIKLEMSYVPGGKFTMGSEKYDSEKPPHQVTVPSFYIGKFQVTQAQWNAVMGDELKPRFKGDDLPMERVSWNDAKEFCQKLAKMTNNAYRLPSEAEWEYACRAGTATEFAFGDSLSSDQANFDGNYPYGGAPKSVYREKTTPVGSFQPNAFGIYDMHGNIWEWCEDYWHENYENAPADGSTWLSGGDSSRRVLRGGSWDDLGSYCRSAVRVRYGPGNRYINIGFRVVVSVRTSGT